MMAGITAMLDWTRDRAPVWRPALLHGLRTAAAVSIALGIAFWLELDNAYWAGTTAAIVCQPVLGSALRKALFRTGGTLVGGTVAILLWAAFPQDRIGFFLSLGGWCALCGFIGHRLTFFAAYGAQLAGYTAAIIAGDVINHPDLAFDIVLARISEIELGIAVATVVLSTTQRDTSRERLAAGIAALARDALAGLSAQRPAFETAALLSRLSALDGIIDQVTGEAFHWRLDLGSIRAAGNGLFDCLATSQLLRLSHGDRSWQALLPETAAIGPCRTAADALTVQPDPESHRAASALSGIATALEVAAWLRAPDRLPAISGAACPAPGDPLPALLTAGRVYLGVIAAAVIWMATAWPNGPGAITWTAIPILLMSPQHEKAFRAAATFGAGTALTAVLAGILKFAILPALASHFDSFWSLSAGFALILVPLAALATDPRLITVISPATVNFVPFVAPTNQMTYDTIDFYNSALSILAGCAMAAVALRVVGPVPASIRTRRIVAAATADCDALATRAWCPTAAQWSDRMRTRLASLPPVTGGDAVNQLILLFGRGADAIQRRKAAPTVPE